MSEVVIVGNPYSNPDTDVRTVQSNATLTVDGYTDYENIGSPNAVLAINIVGTPTGGSPTIQFDLQQIDLGDGETLIGAIQSSTVISAAGNETVILRMDASSSVRVSWTMGGTTPSFTGVYVSLVNKWKVTDPAVDSSRRQIAVGAGIAGTPDGGVLSIQGVSGGTLLDNNIAQWIGSAAPTVGQKTMTASLPVVVSSDQSAMNVRGPDAVGAAPTEAPVRMGGTDQSGSPVIRPVNVDSHGCLNVAGFNTVGSSPVDNPVFVGGVDGAGSIRTFLTDVDGNQQVVGADEDGYATTSAPVQIGAVDGGGLTRSILSDTSGRPLVVGAGTAGSPVGGVLTVQGDGSGTLLPVDVSTWIGSAAPTVGQKAMASSLPVVVSSDQTIIEVDGSGTAGTPAGGVLSIQGVASGVPTNVRGLDAVGATPTENPVRIGGTDFTTNVIRPVNVDSHGCLNVAGNNAVGDAPVDNPIQIGAIDDDTGVIRELLSDVAGHLQVVGPDGDGYASTSDPLQIAGNESDGTVQTIQVDSSGRPLMVGAAPAAGSIEGNPVLTAGSGPGSIVRTHQVDAAGNANVVGPTTTGAAPTTFPLQTSGTDPGGLIRRTRLDTTGRTVTVGAAADGAAVAGDPVLIGGQDGANAQSLLVDTSGRPMVVGAAADGATAAGNPVQVSGVDSLGVARSQGMSPTGNALTQPGDSAAIDAFGRFRISGPITQLDSQFQYDKLPLMWGEGLTGGATATHLPNESSIALTCGTASGDKVVRQTHKFFRYEPGKALAHGEPVLAEAGWTKIENVSVGDVVFDGLGKKTEVVGVYPQGERELYRLTFDDGTHVDADGEHLWKTVIRRNKAEGEVRVLTTLEMLEEHGEEPTGFNRWRIPAAPVLDIEQREVDIDPYTLGAVLGDGHIYKGSSSVSFTTADPEILEYLECSEVTKQANKYGHGLCGLYEGIRKYGLSGTVSDTKFVPHDYKFNSKGVRMDVLRGLMDTDGTVDKRDGCCEYNTASPQLADDVVFLVRSLGGQAKTVQREASYRNDAGEKVVCKDTYRVRVIMPECPFRLQRKAFYWKPRTYISFDRYVHSIKPIGTRQATCIRVASEDHTFLTRNHIVTHNSQLVFLTGVIGAKKANVVKQLGLFSDGNGVFFEQDGTNLKVVIRSSTSGSPVDTAVNQADWNVDKMDGTGPSGITLDETKAQIWGVDYEWLGTGRVRFFVVIAGITQYVHYFLNANTTLTTVYMTTGNLPARYQIENVGVAASSTTLKQTCTTVISEGAGRIASGLELSANNGITALAVSSRRAILSIRPKATFNSITNRGIVIPKEVALFINSKDVLFEIVKNGTIGGSPSWTSAGTNSIVEYDVAGTTVTGGEILTSGYAASGAGSGSAQSTGRIFFAESIEATLALLGLSLNWDATTQDTLSVVLTPNTGTANCQGALTWTEVR